MRHTAQIFIVTLPKRRNRPPSPFGLDWRFVKLYSQVLNHCFWSFNFALSIFMDLIHRFVKTLIGGYLPELTRGHSLLPSKGLREPMIILEAAFLGNT